MPGDNKLRLKFRTALIIKKMTPPKPAWGESLPAVIFFKEDVRRGLSVPAGRFFLISSPTQILFAAAKGLENNARLNYNLFFNTRTLLEQKQGVLVFLKKSLES